MELFLKLIHFVRVFPQQKLKYCTLWHLLRLQMTHNRCHNYVSMFSLKFWTGNLFTRLQAQVVQLNCAHWRFIVVKQTKNPCIMRIPGRGALQNWFEITRTNISLAHWLFKLGANHLDSMFHIVSGKFSHHSSALIHYSDDQWFKDVPDKVSCSIDSNCRSVWP